MNTKNFEQLLSNYIKNFKAINDRGQEYYKWEAVAHFQKHWDIDAPDFLTMYKEAIALSSNLINNSRVQPTYGIVRLAKRAELTEIIREKFRVLLYTDDGGNISKRQDRIEAFTDEINDMLEQYEGETWKNKQTFNGTLMYLNFLAPQDNFIYKYTEAKTFSECIEFGDDLGSGSTFKLNKYYKMCEWLLEHMKANEELVKLHIDRLTDDMCKTDDLHILVFDLLYCSNYCNLYSGIEIFHPTKENIKQRKRNEQLSAIQADIDARSNELNQLLIERSGYDDFPVVGLTVVHKRFGKGKIHFQESSSIVVEFGDDEKKFTIPSAFTSGFLKTDEEAMEILTNINDLDIKISKKKLEISMLKDEYNRV